MAAESTEGIAPIFETESKETFTYPQLRANFHIVNAAVLSIKISPPGKPDLPFRVTASYEGDTFFSKESEAAPPPPPTPEPGGAEDPPKPAPPPEPHSVMLPLLRGRNLVTITHLDDAQTLTFPVYYKTILRDWVESILKALIILVLIQFYVIQTFFIPTGSMEKTLMPGDFIMVEKVSYLFGPPKRGDVVVFQYPDDPRKDFIKRMVAKGGDKVEVVKKQLKVNDHALVEPYAVHIARLSEIDGRPSYRLDRDFFGPQTINRGSIFVMGDNRDNSSDSRFWGQLPLFRMKGKAFLAYWPLGHFGLIRHERQPFRDLDGP